MRNYGKVRWPALASRASSGCGRASSRRRGRGTGSSGLADADDRVGVANDLRGENRWGQSSAGRDKMLAALRDHRGAATREVARTRSRTVVTPFLTGAGTEG